MTVEFRVLGPLEVLRDGTPVEVGGPRQRALLALLLTRSNTTVSRDRIIDELWAEDPPERVVNVLQTYASRLRSVLPPERLVTRPPGYALVVERDELDLHRFERRLEEGRRLLVDGDAQGASESLRRALALWRGPALEDVGERAFARIESARLDELRLGALEERIDADLTLGRHATLVPELEPLVAEHPLRERVRAQLMLALYRSDRQADALAVYRDARATLIEELGMEPGPALRELEASILRQDPSLDLPTTGATVTQRGRSILVVCLDEPNLAALLAFAEPLSRRPQHELVLVRVVPDEAMLAAAAQSANDSRSALAGKATARAAAFTSAEPGQDIVRLAADAGVALLAVDAGERLDGDGRFDLELTAVLREAPCDVAVLAGTGAATPPSDTSPVVVPFGGAEHEWAAAEIGAWIAQAEHRPLRLVGTVGDPVAGRRDASRLLAGVALLVQQVAGVHTEPALADAGADGVAAFSEDARVVLVGLPDDWRSRGAGRTRMELVARTDAPVLLVRSGLRPGGLAPAESVTRFTWTLTDAGP